MAWTDLPRLAWLRRQLGGMTPRERWGYVVWFSLAIAVFVPEVSAVGDHLPWRTISTTTGHLEREWHLLRLIVALLIVATAAHVARFPPHRGARYARPNGGEVGRTRGGRFTARPSADPAAPIDEIPALYYYVPVLAVTVAATAYASSWHNPLYCSYVLYTFIAMFFLVVPSVLAFGWSKDVPFPTMYKAIRNLEGRFHFLATILMAALLILLLHLTFYPWPNLDFG